MFLLREMYLCSHYGTINISSFVYCENYDLKCTVLLIIYQKSGPFSAEVTLPEEKQAEKCRRLCSGGRIGLFVTVLVTKED